MAVTLYVDREPWLAQVRAAWAALTTPAGPPLPVVKGNGYGFGRAPLADVALTLGATDVAVGTVHELDAVPAGLAATVLTPALARELPSGATAALTVAAPHHVDELRTAGFQGEVVVKLASPMRRYGVDAGELNELLALVEDAGWAVRAFALHLPLETSGAEQVDMVGGWLTELPAGSALHVGHVEPDALQQLAARRPEIAIRARVGTALWHGDKAHLRLRADVLDCRPVRAGERAGYRLREVPADGVLVMASGGTAHGVQPLADGRSPFHFQRTRLELFELHMHTAMVFVPAGGPTPQPGDQLDLQRPLTQTWPDAVVGLA